MLTVEQAKQKYQGVVIPLATIFAKDGSLDIESTKYNVQWIMDQGAKQNNTVFLAAGSGGDFTSMSTEERKQTIKAVADVADGKVPVMTSAQSTDIRVTIDLCKYCESIGVDLVQLAGPYYYSVKPDDTVAFLKEVSKHTKVGFAIYNHFYSGSRYDMPLSLVDRCLDEVPNAIALKWAAGSLEKEYEGILRFSPRAAVLHNNLMGFVSHVLGCRAYVSHVPNFFPKYDWKMWDMMEAGDYAGAKRMFDAFMMPYFGLVGQIMEKTAGEGVFTRVGLAAAGLKAGVSRFPSRDEAVSPAVKAGFKKLLKDVEVLMEKEGGPCACECECKPPTKTTRRNCGPRKKS